MNSQTTTPAQPLQTSTSARIAGAGFAAVMTLAMLLGVNTLASVDTASEQMAQAQPAASAART